MKVSVDVWLFNKSWNFIIFGFVLTLWIYLTLCQDISAKSEAFSS